MQVKALTDTKWLWDTAFSVFLLWRHLKLSGSYYLRPIKMYYYLSQHSKKHILHWGPLHTQHTDNKTDDVLAARQQVYKNILSHKDEEKATLLHNCPSQSLFFLFSHKVVQCSRSRATAMFTLIRFIIHSFFRIRAMQTLNAREDYFENPQLLNPSLEENMV